MKFIVNFIIFGLIFYGIYVFFPTAFETLVSWAEAVFNFVEGLYQKIVSHYDAPAA